MLNSDDRRPNFDAFWRSLDDATQTVFIEEARDQWDGIQGDEPQRTVSLIDCMENVWDHWRELRELNASKPEILDDDDRAIALVMDDEDRRTRERAYNGRFTDNEQKLHRRIHRAYRNGVPAVTSVLDARSVKALQAAGLIRWDDNKRRWFAV